METWTSAARLTMLVPLGALIYAASLLISSRGTIEGLWDFMLEGLRGTRQRAATNAS
jgi:hypothetical protein